jgi:heat shock protein HtpX
MTMNFWEAQRQARKQTAFYVAIFIVLSIGVAVFAEWAMRMLGGESYEPPFPYIGLAFLAITCCVALFQYSMFKTQGGAYVAESVGAVRLDPRNASAKHLQLLNVVEEVALAAGLPVPAVYLINAQEINAFAAGLTSKDAVIAVTQGSVYKLNRDELQGVIAHEFGHIRNFDMLLNMRIAAMVMGFFFVLYMALRILQFADFRSSREEGRRGNPLVLAALILLAAGAFMWFAGSVLRSMVSRQREYLADASAVQFTRNPSGIANALRKIAREQSHDMPQSGIAYSHMYLEDTTWTSMLFATHPPLKKRIEAIE